MSTSGAHAAAVGAGYVGLAMAAGLAEHGQNMALVERGAARLAVLE